MTTPYYIEDHISQIPAFHLFKLKIQINKFLNSNGKVKKAYSYDHRPITTPKRSRG